MDLTDRVAVVTGASSGIGEATARTLAAEGCSVVLAARREDRLEALEREIGTDRALAVPTDVTDEDDVAALVERTREAFGGIDVLVNNAGVSRPAPVLDADGDDVERQIGVNLLGVANVTRAALPEMLEAATADVVAVSSVSARRPGEGASAYAASKCGVNGFCESLRKEVAEDGVRVTVVMPGATVTEMNDWEHWDHRAMAPSDVAETIAFAVSRPDHVSIPELTVTTSVYS